MVLVLRHDGVRAAVTMADTIKAIEAGFREEGHHQPDRAARTGLRHIRSYTLQPA